MFFEPGFNYIYWKSERMCDVIYAKGTNKLNFIKEAEKDEIEKFNFRCFVILPRLSSFTVPSDVTVV